MQLRNMIPTMAQLYKSAILPHFSYCRLVWHFCRASDTRGLERLQEGGLRAVFRDTHLNCQQLLHTQIYPLCVTEWVMYSNVQSET